MPEFARVPPSSARSSPTSDAPLLAVTGGTLVLAPRGTGGQECAGARQRPYRRTEARTRSWTRPYARLLAAPGTARSLGGSLLARLPLGMFTVSALTMIAERRGSYALAGAVTATGLAVTALVAPWVARQVDRHGPARAAVPAGAFAVLGSLALLICVRVGAPDWTLFAAYAATATTPNVGGMARARWARLFAEDTAENAVRRHTARSFEQAADELCFLLGPVLAAVLCSVLFPEAGTLAGAVLLLTGVLVFTGARDPRPTGAGSRPARARTPLRSAALTVLLAVFLATGAVFGATEVVTLAVADAGGRPGWAGGGLLALQAAGSCAAGLLLGLLRPAPGAARRLTRSLGVMSVLLVLPLLAALSGAPALLAVALLTAGAATAPTMVTGMALVQRLVPGDRLNEGMTLTVTALLGGIAAGSAFGGWTVERLDPALGYLVPPAAAAAALLISLGGRAVLRGTGDEPAPDTTEAPLP